MPRPKKIALTIIAIAVGLAMVHYWFDPGLKAIIRWAVYRTEGQKIQKAREDHEPNNTKEAQRQPAARQDLYSFAGDDNSVKP